jgi:hypothetical protein
MWHPSMLIPHAPDVTTMPQGSWHHECKLLVREMAQLACRVTSCAVSWAPRPPQVAALQLLMPCSDQRAVAASSRGLQRPNLLHVFWLLFLKCIVSLGSRSTLVRSSRVHFVVMLLLQVGFLCHGPWFVCAVGHVGTAVIVESGLPALAIAALLNAASEVVRAQCGACYPRLKCRMLCSKAVLLESFLECGTPERSLVLCPDMGCWRAAHGGSRGSDSSTQVWHILSGQLTRSGARCRLTCGSQTERGTIGVSIELSLRRTVPMWLPMWVQPVSV